MDISSKMMKTLVNTEQINSIEMIRVMLVN